jgi:hypothetical protein
MSIFAPTSLDKFLNKTRLSWTWFVVLVGIVLLILPLLVAFADGFIQDFFYEGVWRTMYMAPAILVYILALQKPMDVAHKRAVLALRKVIQLDDAAFEKIVLEASRVDARGELLAFLLGAAFGFWANGLWSVEGDYEWLKIYFPLTGALLWGTLSWVIYSSVVSTKLQTILHQQPMKFDIFNLRPFEPIGKYSLIMALVFVGGFIISVLFINPLANDSVIFSLTLYAILAAITALVFFLSMRDTHKVLSAEKKRALELAELKISEAFQSLSGGTISSGDMVSASTELNLWLKYEARLKVARTWPYNTAMIRTLALSILLPATVSLLQRLLAFILS